MNDYSKKIEQYIQNEIRVLEGLSVSEINDFINTMEEARLRGGLIYICGNGGSASTASHFVCDFNKGISSKLNPSYHIICLNDSMALVSALGNDVEYAQCFSRQLEGIITAKDLLIVISGSGNSPNVVNALEVAESVGADTLALCGQSGGIVKEKAKHFVHVRSESMQIVEDMHLMLDHLAYAVLTGQLDFDA